MASVVTIRTVEPTPTAVVKASTTWAEFSSQWKPMLDQVWSFLRDAPAGLFDHGHNVMLYKDAVPNVEVGVQLRRSFEPVGAVVASFLPGGLVATATHIGPIDRLGDTYDDIRTWCLANGYTLAGPHWEIYGDPDRRTGQFAVDVFHAVTHGADPPPAEPA